MHVSLQVNNGATCLLYRTAGDWTSPGPETLLVDVCCGTGTIGLTLAKRLKHVIGVDNAQSAIDDAKANAALNGISNCTFVCGTAESVLEGILQVRAAA